MTAKKKILFAITKSNFGGAQRYVFDLATHLPGEYEPLVAFGGTGGKDADAGVLAERLSSAGIRTVLISAFMRDVSLFEDFAALRQIVALCRCERPDVVHLNSSKAGGLGALAARVAGVPNIVFTAHGWPFLEKRRVAWRVAAWFFSWLTALLAHRVICVSQNDLRVARTMPFIRRKAVCIHNGMSEVELLPRTHSDEVRILTNAELTANKNLYCAIDAVVKARDAGARVTYALMGSGELKDALAAYIEKRGGQTFISLLGFVPEGRRHYSQYDIFFLPSKKEGLPYVLLEAGAASLPAVASRVGGIPEILEDGVSGYMCAPNDTEGFARALTQLANDATMRIRMGEALHRTIAEKFSIESMVAETLKVYTS